MSNALWVQLSGQFRRGATMNLFLRHEYRIWLGLEGLCYPQPHLFYRLAFHMIVTRVSWGIP